MQKLTYLCVSLLVASATCYADETEAVSEEDTGTCSSGEVDMVPKSYYQEALNKLVKFDETIIKKDQLVKDIRSRFKYLKKTIKDLDAEKAKEVEEKEELQELVKKLDDLVPDYGKGLEHNVWRLKSDLKICKEDLRLKEKEEEAQTQNLNQFVRDLAAMHQLEINCRKELKECKKQSAKEECPQCVDHDELRTKLAEMTDGNGELEEKLGLCENWVKILNQMNSIDVMSPGELKDKMTEDDGVEIEVEEEVEVLKRTPRMIQPIDEIEGIKLDDEVPEERQFRHPMPWKPQEIPDVTNMSREEMYETFLTVKEDYELIFDLAVESDDNFINCMKQRQDMVVLKYFMTKDLSLKEYQLAEATEQKEKLETTCKLMENSTGDADSDLTTCQEKLKETEQYAAYKSKEIEELRESKVTKDEFEAINKQRKSLQEELGKGGLEGLLEESRAKQLEKSLEVQQLETQLARKGVDMYKAYFYAMSTAFAGLLLLSAYHIFIPKLPRRKARKPKNQ